ncbi:YusW family protein [Metabacillus lacus]|nr:YusW family protein [Metabacillus lacus]
MDAAKKLIPVFLISGLVISGCNTSDDMTRDDAVLEENQSEREATDAAPPQSETAETDALRFKEFELEVEYEDGTYEAEYEGTELGEEGEIEDGLNGSELKGEEAVSALKARLDNLTITADSQDQEVIQEVLEKFQLPEDYKSFKLKINYTDDREVRYEDSQS